MKNTDQTATIQELKTILRKFREERNWRQFHTPKNLAEAITIESGELLELFLWKKERAITEALDEKEFRQKVSHELADIMCYCLNFANATGIDVTTAVLDKVEKNKKKYPVEKSKNSARKYTEL